MQKDLFLTGSQGPFPKPRPWMFLMTELGTKVDLMLSLDAPEDELVERLLLRGKDSGRADDSNEEVIRNRIGVYNDQTAVASFLLR